MRIDRFRLPALVLALTMLGAACGQAQPPASPSAASPTPAGNPSPAPASPTVTSPAAAASPVVLTVADVYRRVEQTLDQPGRIYHATVQMDGDFGLFAGTTTIRRWVDARRKAAREEAEHDLRAAVVEEGAPPMTMTGTTTTLLTEGGRYAREPNGRLTTTPARTWTCHGAGIAASAVLGCPGPTEQSTTTVQQGQYDGRPAVVLVTSGTSRGSDETFTFTDRLYLDPGTFLPIALEGEGEIDFGRTRPTRQRRIYTHEFIPADAVPAGFFDPASIGYAEPRPEEPLDGAAPDLAVYWLGTRSDGPGDLPPLVLKMVTPADPQRGPGYRFRLDYTRADDPHGPPVVTLELWSRATWENRIANPARAKGQHIWEQPCWERREIALPDGRATIFAGFAPEPPSRRARPETSGPCPDRPRDRFLAHAYLGETVVFVTMPGAGGAGGVTKSPYDTREGIEALVRALQPREGR